MGRTILAALVTSMLGVWCPVTPINEATLSSYFSASDSTAEGRAPVNRDDAPFQTLPSGVFKMLLEKTLLNVDVLTLEVQVEGATARKLETLAQKKGRRYGDEVTRAVLEAPESWVRMKFLRSVNQARFLNGIRANLGKARRAGLITEEHYRQVQADLPHWYDFLAQRGVKKGDILVYWMRGPSLQTSYYGVEGRVLFDFFQNEPEAHLGVLGSYFAPGSEFREGLIRSVAKAPTPSQGQKAARSGGPVGDEARSKRSPGPTSLPGLLGHTKPGLGQEPSVTSSSSDRS